MKTRPKSTWEREHTNPKRKWLYKIVARLKISTVTGIIKICTLTRTVTHLPGRGPKSILPPSTVRRVVAEAITSKSEL